MHVVLGGGDLTATVDVSSGGRIVSLSAYGREWLAPSSPLPVTEPRCFVHDGTGGWDDAIPTVAACTTPAGIELPDHGDVWDREWRVTSQSERHLSTSVELTSLPLRLERLITATTTGLRFDWRVTTASARPIEFLWSAHPLFLAEPGTRIELGGPADLVEEYPRRGQPGELPRSIDELPTGAALKLFASGLSTAAVVHPDRSTLSLDWDAAELPFLGLYLDRGEFTTRPVLAIEPTMAATDSAARAENLWSVSAGDERIWHLDIAVTGGPEPRTDSPAYT